jgi:glycosyltransferase involved in cell wall biosynthesis
MSLTRRWRVRFPVDLMGRGAEVSPLVSVIIPTFNRKDLVLKALQSVEQQTYPSIEAIVADDCSTDGTAEAVADCNFRMPVWVVRSPVNQGPASARNLGIARASGKYIAFLDSDDLWLPTKLARQVEAAERSESPEQVLVCSFCKILRRHETIVRPRRPISQTEDVADYLFASDGGFIAQPTVLISTSVARKVLYRADLRLHEDWDWYIRLQRHGIKFIMLPEVHCVVDDRATQGRGSAPRPDLSLSVLEKWKSTISPKAYLAFRAKIAPQMRHTEPLRALGMISEAYLNRAISTWILFVLIGRWIHPGLREFAYRLRGAMSRYYSTFPVDTCSRDAGSERA